MMKKLLIIAAIVLSVCACGHKNGSKPVTNAKAVAVDSTAIRDSIAKADSTAIVSYL